MKVPFLYLKKHNNIFKTDYLKAFSEFLDSGQYILGENVKEFESQFSKFVGTKYALGVSNCLDGLEILLNSINVKSGDEIIVPSNTYIATWLSILNAGAIPVPVEPDINTFNIDPRKIESSISKKTKAIIVVHLYGLPCDMDPINEIAQKNGIYVFEDSAQSHGSLYKSKMTGNLGDASAFSFFPSKNIGALGDAGVITTNNKTIFHKAKLIRNYGSEVKYYNEVIGRNNRLDELQAAFLLIRLNTILEENNKRRLLAKRYLMNLQAANLPIRLPNKYNIQAEHSWHLFVILSPLRDQLQNYLHLNNIETLLHYPVCPHKQKALKDHPLSELDFPISEQIHRECLSLPISSMHSLKEVDYVCEKILDFFNNLK